MFLILKAQLLCEKRVHIDSQLFFLKAIDSISGRMNLISYHLVCENTKRKKRNITWNQKIYAVGQETKNSIPSG